jgi:O-succinylbenzoate synthase
MASSGFVTWSRSRVDEIVIRRARLYEVALPLKTPFVISGGELAVRRSLIVELEDASGGRGFGESAPFEAPFYSAETTASARACLAEELLPRVLAQPVASSEAMHQLLGEGVRGNRMARAGAETAWWDLRAARLGVSLAETVSRRLAELGVAEANRQRRPSIECGVALGIPGDGDVARLKEEIRAAVARGYRRVKLKVRPGWDHEAVAAAVEVFAELGRTLPLWVDANGAYRAECDRDALRALDAFDLLFIEQPFSEDALWDAAVWNRVAATPVCLDESLVSDEAARQVIEMGGPMIWNLKVQRLGGLEETCRVYARGIEHGAQLWMGTMPETGLGAQASLAVAGHSGFDFPSDLEPSERWYGPGIDLLDLQMDRVGRMAVPHASVEPVLGPTARLVCEIG